MKEKKIMHSWCKNHIHRIKYDQVIFPFYVEKYRHKIRDNLPVRTSSLLFPLFG